MKRLKILRHAERHPIQSSELGNDVMLTERGKWESRLFGQLISQPVLGIRTSPIERCRQTAELIANEVDIFKKNIETTTILGDPGFIIDDADQAWMHWKEKGNDKVNQYLLNGSDRWLGFVELDEAVRVICSEIRAMLIISKPGIHIWVTHDTILATLASRVAKVPLSLEQWPEFLGCLDINLLENSELEFSYQPKAIVGCQ